MNNAEQLTKILTIILMVMILILMLLTFVYIMIKWKSKKKEKERTITDENNKTNIPKSDAKKIAKEYTKESIFEFMDFDKIEDNMIIQKNGNRYLMVVECQGINYDLMSEAEKVSVEEGFLQFLNTLRHPIQIYIQTRTVNLNDSIQSYKKKLQAVEMELEKRKNEYQRKVQSGKYTQDELEKEFYEVTKQTNLYEYGKDIILNTERMSLNKNVLNKKYYIILSYYPEDLKNGSFGKDEIENLAFSELYTQSQSLIRTLASCEVVGKIMNSMELVELLYIAYNRDDAEVFSVDRAIRSGYDELYTTAPDVLNKKMQILDEEIEKQALELVKDNVIKVRSKKQREIDEKQAHFGELIRQRAEIILKQNASYLGTDTAEEAIEIIQEKQEDTDEIEENIKQQAKLKTKEEGGHINEEQQAKKTTRGRKPKSTK